MGTEETPKLSITIVTPVGNESAIRAMPPMALRALASKDWKTALVPEMLVSKPVVCVKMELPAEEQLRPVRRSSQSVGGRPALPGSQVS